jgi:hypothetical protein
MRIEDYHYYFRRLRSMRSDEPYHRARSLIRHWWEKARIGSDPEVFSTKRVWDRRKQWLFVDQAEDLSAALSPLSRESIPHGCWNDPVFWDTFSHCYVQESDTLISKAESAINGILTLFQWKEIRTGDQVAWSSTLEPDRPGENWPEAYHSDLSVGHDPSRPQRDIKWCWELNRFQHLLCLGAAWRITRDERFAHEARSQIESWIRTVTYPFGVQWNSNLEVGLRALSWARCHILCQDSKVWNHDFLTRFLPSLYLHARHLEHELTVHHALSNHVLGEASSLWCISLWYPVFIDTPRWKRRSQKILNQIVPQLILPDGVYAEQTTGYFRFVCEFLFPLLCMENQDAAYLNRTVKKRVGAGLHFVKTISAAMSDVPMIGDADTGLAIGWQLSDYWDFTPLFASGSVVLDRPDLGEGVLDFPAESFLLLGDMGRESFQRCSKRSREGRVMVPQDGDLYDSPDSSGHRSTSEFPGGGYLVSRDNRFHVLFDGGKLGIPPGYGHGHLDGLSFLMSYEGQSVLIDPGTYLYNGPKKWREYFRSAGAHNTVTIRGIAPSTPLDTFRWKRDQSIRIEAPERYDTWALLSGTIEYHGVRHCRSLYHLVDQGIVIVDQVAGNGDRRMESRLHVHPAWKAEIVSKNRVTLKSEGKALEIVMWSQEACRLSTLHGSTDPRGGWYSRYYGYKEPSLTLIGTFQTVLPAVMAMAIRPLSVGLTMPHDLVIKGLPKEHDEAILSHLFTPSHDAENQ